MTHGRIIYQDELRKQCRLNRLLARVYTQMNYQTFFALAHPDGSYVSISSID